MRVNISRWRLFPSRWRSPLNATGDASKNDGGIHGGDDLIAPIGASAMLSSQIVKGATLKIYAGAPHGMCSTLKNRVNAELLAFFKGAATTASA